MDKSFCYPGNTGTAAFAAVLTVVFLLFYTVSFSQEDENNLLITKPYLAHKGSDTDKNVYLVKIVPASVKEFNQKYSADIKRQIAANWFIVRKNKQLLSDSSFINLYPATPYWKLSPTLLRSFFNRAPAEPYTFLIQINNGDSLPKSIANAKAVTIISGVKIINTIQIKTTLSYLEKNIIPDTAICFIDGKFMAPKEELVINNYDYSVNATGLLMAKYPDVMGQGLSVSIKENLFDTTDIDFKGRYLFTSNESSSITTHATTMATLIAGGGNSFHTGKGIAPECRLTSSDFQNLLPDSNVSYQRYGTTVQNHSYGTGIENFYGADAAAFDEATLENPNLVYVFSSGNSGALTDSTGIYNGLPGFATLTGSFKQAKNIITAGSVDSFFRVAAASSKGPAYDGRIKPELVAYGNDGSSGAAAITSGVALALQSAYRLAHHDSLPGNSLVKAVLLNSADDVFNEGPDYYSGYGNVNAYQAVKDIVSGHFHAGNSRQNSTDSFSIPVPDNIKKIKITLVWNDAPAAPNAFTALVNDLDLSLKNKDNNTVWLPWVLNSSPDSVRLLSPPQRRRDSLNVAEQITLDHPRSGNYTIYINGYNIVTDSQPYSVAYELDTANQFQFVSPSGADHFQGGGKSIIRWRSTYNNSARGSLSYSTDKGATWKLIEDSVPLINSYHQWLTPDTSAIALLRMRIGSDVFFSDTFDFSKQPFIHVVTNCPDSSLLTWHSAAGVTAYRVFQLGETYLQRYRDVSDTSITITQNSSPYIAVSPLLSTERTGLNSYTIDISKQGAGCYINNFLADLTDDHKAQLTLQLGTINNVDSVWFQRLENGRWKTVYITQSISDATIQNLFSPLMQGANTFRAVVWVNGVPVNSPEAGILYYLTADFIIKPNPLPQGQRLSVLASTLVTGTMAVYDVWGRKLLQQEVNNATNTINTSSLARGIYFLVIYDNKQAVYKSRLVIN